VETADAECGGLADVVTAALGFSPAGFAAALPECLGNTALLPVAGLGRNSSRFAANTANASTAIKKTSASTWFLVLIQLPQRCAVPEDGANACLAPWWLRESRCITR
jgi:hypothetical protein